MPEFHAFMLDRLATPVGELLIVADADGRLRAIDWSDYESRMHRLLDRYYGAGRYRISPARDSGRPRRSGLRTSGPPCSVIAMAVIFSGRVSVISCSFEAFDRHGLLM